MTVTLALALGITIGAALTLLLEYLLDHRQRRHPHRVSRREFRRLEQEWASSRTCKHCPPNGPAVPVADGWHRP